MSTELCKQYDEDFSLFIDTGFLSIVLKEEILARRSFAAARVLRPDNSIPDLGIAYIHLNKLEHIEARKLLKPISNREPNNELAKALLAIANLLDAKKKEEGKKILEELKKKSQDPSIVHLATTSMEWEQKDLSKRSESPFF